MVTIYNSEVTKGLSKNAGIQTAFENPPNQLADKIVPTFETNPECLRKCNFVKLLTKTNTGATAITTTPADKDFFIIAIGINGSVSVLNDGIIASITGSLDGGSTIDLSKLNFQPLTALSNIDNFRSLIIPIKMAKNVAINANLAFTAGTSAFSFAIYGYTVENPNI